MSSPSISLYTKLETIQPVEVKNTSNWTDVKVKRVWAYVIAGICLAAAIALAPFTFTVSLWIWAAVIPLALSSGGLVYYARSLTDYDNPKELEAVRNRAAQWPLSKVIEKHGMEKVFRYRILSPEQFEKAFKEHVHPMDLRSLMGFHKECSQYAVHFPIPPLKEFKQKLIDETKGLHFETLKNRYPLDFLIRQELINTDDLLQSFHASAENCNLNQLIDLYEKTRIQIAHLHIPNFSLPKPAKWKGKFREETAHMSCTQIMNSYPLKPATLLQHEIITPSELDYFDRAQKAVQLSQRKESQCLEEFETRTTEARTIRDRSKKIAQETYDSNSIHGILRDLNATETCELASIEKQTRAEIEEALRPSNRYWRSIPGFVVTGPGIYVSGRLHSRAERRLKENIDLIRSRAGRKESSVQDRYEKQRKDLLLHLKSASSLREETCKLADQQFTMATQPAKEERDQKLEYYELERDRNLDEVNRAYDQFRRAAS